ncbi:MAG: hypothetical protein ACRCZE_02335 [Candidatus Altimarinota bacterium]
MKQLNQTFRSRAHQLVLQIIEDKAENKPYLLLDALFDREFKGSLDHYPNFKQDWLFPYFAEAKKASGAPFAGIDNQSEQIFFLNQLKSQIRHLTYNFKKLDLIFPKQINAPANAPTAQPDFHYSTMEKNLVLIGLVLPVLHSLEQKEINKVSAAQGQTTTSQTSEQANPYESLDKELLVQGMNGEFNQIITYNDLQKLYIQVQEMRSNGVDQAQIIQFLRAELQAKGIRTTENGEIIPFISGLQSQETSDSGEESLSIDQAFALMDQRMGLKVQQSIMIASKGNLSLPAVDINYFKNNGETLVLGGVDVFFDSSGRLSSENIPGNNFLMFFRDANGDLALVSGNKQSYRNENKTDYGFLISRDGDQIHENDPGFALADEDLDQTELPLATLLENKGQPEQFSPENIPQTIVIAKPKSNRASLQQANAPITNSETEIDGEVQMPVNQSGLSYIPIKFKPLTGPLDIPRSNNPQQVTVTEKTSIKLPPSGSKITQPLARAPQPNQTQTTPARTNSQTTTQQPPRRKLSPTAQADSAPSKTPNFMLRSLVTQGATVSGVLGSIITFLS